MCVYVCEIECYGMCPTYSNTYKVSFGHIIKYSLHDDIIAVGEVLKSKYLTTADSLCLPGQLTEGVIVLQI